MNILFQYFVATYYYKQTETRDAVNHIYEIYNTNEHVKVEFNKNRDFYESQIKLSKKHYKLVLNIFACCSVEKYKQQILKINETWGLDVEKEENVKILFFLGEDEKDSDFSGSEKYIYLKGVKGDYLSASYKQNLGLKYIYENYSFDYIFTFGTDTYINIKKCLKYIETFDKNKKLYIGGHGDYRTINNKLAYFHSGGSGFILSNSVLYELYPMLNTITDTWIKLCLSIPGQEYLYACDVAIAHYISTFENLEIIINNSGFFACNFKGLCSDDTFDCCAKKNIIKYKNIVTCHCMSLKNFDEYNVILKTNNYFI